MSSWHEFFTMGGYGWYVWPAYGVAFAIMVVNAVAPVRRKRELIKRLRQRASSKDRLP